MSEQFRAGQTVWSNAGAKPFVIVAVDGDRVWGRYYGDYRSNATYDMDLFTATDPNQPAEPVPQNCPFDGKEPIVHEGSEGTTFSVMCPGGPKTHWCLRGPNRPSRREAILAWNSIRVEGTQPAEPPPIREQGLLNMYRVEKADGSPADPNAVYFVLRLDNGGRDAIHLRACRGAALIYAEMIEEHIPKLAVDLRWLVDRFAKTDQPAEPKPCPCCGANPVFIDGGLRVDCPTSGCILGPLRGSKRDAVLAWNAMGNAAAEREACAKIADFWASDEGESPCHGDANRFGQKAAGRAIAHDIRSRGELKGD